MEKGEPVSDDIILSLISDRIAKTIVLMVLFWMDFKIHHTAKSLDAYEERNISIDHVLEIDVDFDLLLKN